MVRSRRARWSLVAVIAVILTGACTGNPAQPAAPLPLGGQSNTADGLPAGAQAGTIKVPISCNVPFLGNQDFLIDLTGVAATAVGPGQQFYVTQAHGSIEIPPAVASAMALVGVASVSASITNLEMNVTSARPASLNMASAPINISSIPIDPGRSSRMAVPQSGTLTIGPFTAGAAGVIELSIGAARATMTLKNGLGGNVLTPQDVRCSAPDPTVALAGISIGGPAGQAPSRFDGVAVDTSDVPAGFVTGSTRSALTCAVPGVGDLPVVQTLTGTLSVIVGSRKPYWYQDVTATLDLTAPAVAQIVTRTGAARLSAVITGLNLDANNSTPATRNVADPALAVPPVALIAGYPASLTAPQTSTLQVGPFTAGASGRSSLSLGATGVTLSLLNAGNAPIGSPLAVTCTAPDPPVTLVQEISTGSTPRVDSLSATAGSRTGGNTVTITGTGFNGTRAVNFGHAQAAFNVVSNTSMTAEVPAHTAGVIDVTVIGQNGPSVTTTADHYTYR
jgi:hypothetical protein